MDNPARTGAGFGTVDRVTSSHDLRLPPGQLDLVRRELDLHAGTVTSADLHRLGVGPDGVRRLVAAGVLRRVGRSAFVDGDRHERADPAGRHVLRATAVARTWPPDVLVSHTSAALMHGLPLTVVPDRVHGCRRGAGQHRRRAGSTIHAGYTDARHTTVHGVEVLEPVLVVMGVAQLRGRDEAVVVGDAALHRQLVTHDALRTAVVTRPHHPVHATFVRAIDLMDARTESPGETLSRLLLRGLGYTPVPQVVIRDELGAVIGRVDFLLQGTRVIVEFDGMVKYASPDALVREKRREIRLQRAGYVVVRLIWSDLSRPERVRSLVGAALATARRAG